MEETETGRQAKFYSSTTPGRAQLERKQRIGVACRRQRAPIRDVLRLVMRFGARFILPGIRIGVAASLGAARILGSQLWGVSPHDPVALVSVVAMLLTVGFLTCWVPTRRAKRVGPVVALRYE